MRTMFRQKVGERKGKQIMLQFLQTGRVLYVLAAVCGLGVISKLVTSSLYKRLIKATGNMALTKNKNLRLFRQKTENMLMLSHGIRNTNAYIEKQLYSFRFMKLSLDGWDNLSLQAMLVCFLIGGLAAFGAYWYRCGSYYIVLYGTMGILTGLFLVLVDNTVNVSVKRQQLTDCLVDYVDNAPHYFRNVDRKLKVVDENVVNEAGVEAGIDNKDVDKKEEQNFVQKKFPVLSKKKQKKLMAVPMPGNRKRDNDPAPEEELRRSIDGLKQSLEQIAASREQTKTDLCASKSRVNEGDGLERSRRELSQEDIKLLGELLQEYFK